MFERFTDRSRRAVVLAQEHARVLGHNYIGTEHILLGLLDADGVASSALLQLGVERDELIAEVASIVGDGGISPRGHIPFTPRAKKVIELALREALQLGHNYIGTEHLLLGLVREGEGIGLQALRLAWNIEPKTVRSTVIQVLSGYGAAPAPTSKPAGWVDIVPRPHVCKCPDAAEVNELQAHTGSTWRCTCGTLFALEGVDKWGQAQWVTEGPA